MSAAEYLAKVADESPIAEVEKELETVKQAPSVRGAVDDFWCRFWQEISRRY